MESISRPAATAKFTVSAEITNVCPPLNAPARAATSGCNAINAILYFWRVTSLTRLNRTSSPVSGLTLWS